MAYIRRRTVKGKPRYLVCHRGPDGRERARTFTRHDDAKAYLSRLTLDRRNGMYADPRQGTAWTFANVADSWLQARSLRLRPTTIARDDSYLRSIILPALGDLPVSKVDTIEVRRFVAEVHRSGKAPATTAKALTMVRSIIAHAVDDRILPPGAALGKVDTPKVRRHEIIPLSAEQVARMVDAAGVFWGTHLLVLAGTGLRWGEFAGLDVSDLDLEAGELRVCQQLVELAGTFEITSNLKTPWSSRTVSIPSSVRDRIVEHHRRFPPVGGRAFSTINGKILRRSNFLRNVLRPAARRVGVEQARTHDLRHHHASVLLAAGEPIMNVSKRLGHRDSAVTLSVYSHVLEGADQGTADRYDALMRGLDADSPDHSNVVSFKRRAL